MNERGITKTVIIAELSKSPHGKLEEYVPTCAAAAKQEPEFLAHLIAYNQVHGQIRDSKVAMPVISLSVSSFNDPEFVSNSLAHLAMLDPRNLVRAFRFAKSLSGLVGVGPATRQVFGVTAEQAREGYRVTEIVNAGEIHKVLPGRPGNMMAIRRLVARYLRHREDNWGLFERTAVQHRNTLRELYSLAHIKPSEMANVILFGRHLDKTPGQYPAGSIFAAIANLKNMSPLEAAGTILDKKIPFLIAKGALGAKAKDPDVVLALINRMTPSELVNNAAGLEKLGVKTVPALRAAFEAALAKASTSTKNTLKATKAAESVEDEGLKTKMQNLQEKQIKTLGGIEGNWLVLGDKSGSMSQAIETARFIAGTLAKLVKGEVYLVFFDTQPRFVKATGKTYEQILDETRRIDANGGTSVGCGLLYAMEAGFDVDGIAIVSDGGENNSPMFSMMYERYAKKYDKHPPVYFYKVHGDNNMALENSMKQAQIDFQEYDLRGGVDYYSVVNLVQTMRANRYSLVEQIMETPLLSLDAVLPLAKERVLVSA